MIGFYIHHVGRGHLHRARALAGELTSRGHTVAGLSSLSRPTDWPGDWIDLPRDDDGRTEEVTAYGRLHWAPLRHPGLRSRMASLSAWLERADAALMVVDVSVEVLLLARLHGVPTLAVLQPGRRDDAAHVLGYDVADSVAAFWPDGVDGMTEGLSSAALGRLVQVGAMSRHDVAPRPLPGDRRGSRSVVVLMGAGGHDISASDLEAAQAVTPGWHWTVLDGSAATWVEDPSAVLASADVIITHAGQNAIAETATARRPAVVIPQVRPHAEQVVTASVLADGWPVAVRPSWPAGEFPSLLEDTATLDGERWADWCDGLAGDRFCDLVEKLVDTTHRPMPV